MNNTSPPTVPPTVRRSVWRPRTRTQPVLALRDVRERRQLRRDDLAVASGVAASTLGVLERDSSDARISTLLALARALRCRLSDLVPEVLAVDAGAVPLATLDDLDDVPPAHR